VRRAGKRVRIATQFGIEVIRLPPKARNLNAYAERFVRSIKDESRSRIRRSTGRHAGTEGCSALISRLAKP